MVKALFDTNILIDYLRGLPQARNEIALYESKAISIVSWMEVMVGAAPEVEAVTLGFLSGFEQIPLDSRIACQSVELRRKHRIKLPDAMIWASARVHSMLLVTRNTRDYPRGDPGVRMPYVIGAPANP
jgi:predicted nucleic acid-binding protein